jgi:hypothetical protein
MSRPGTGERARVFTEPIASLLFAVPHPPRPLAEGQDGWARSRTNKRV